MHATVRIRFLIWSVKKHNLIAEPATTLLCLKLHAKNTPNPKLFSTNSFCDRSAIMNHELFDCVSNERLDFFASFSLVAQYVSMSWLHSSFQDFKNLAFASTAFR